MRVIVQKTNTLQGVITPPGSKSEAVRALMFALLSKGTSNIQNLPDGEDVTHAMNIVQAMGAQINRNGTVISVNSQGLPFQPISPSIYTGNSGITTRFLLPLLGLRAHPNTAIILDCGEQMRARPMKPLFDALRHLGLNIEYQDKSETLPIAITGRLIGGNTSVNGLSSQYLSALLIALPLAAQSSEISVIDLHERPYVDLTLAWLKRVGINIIHRQETSLDTFIIPGGQSYRPLNTILPGDYSSASYFIAAGAMFPGEIMLNGLNQADTQGDKQLIDIVKAMGADITYENGMISINGGRPLKGISIDANAIPDLLPTLAVLGTVASGQTEIYNVPQARLKETDRIHSMTEGLRKLGANIEEKSDGMVIKHSSLRGAPVKGYGDHRTVMAMTLAGLMAAGTTEISEAQSINKTYPTFMDEMVKLGGSLEVHHD